MRSRGRCANDQPVAPGLGVAGKGLAVLSRLALRWVLWRVESAIRGVEARARSCGSALDLEGMFACWPVLDDLQAKRRALLNSTEAMKKHRHKC